MKEAAVRSEAETLDSARGRFFGPRNSKNDPRHQTDGTALRFIAVDVISQGSPQPGTPGLKD